MKNCTDCKHAEWARTDTGRMSPSGNGRCRYPYQVPPLPSSMYWIQIGGPAPSGGYINRRKELSDHCPYFARAET